MIDFRGRNDAEIQVRCYLVNPQKVNDAERLEYWDKSAADHIQQLQQAIEDLTGYRKQIFDRSQTVFTAPYNLKISLKREKRYQDKVYYFLTVEKVFVMAKIDPLLIENHKYTGTERAQAIKDYRAALKAHPGVACEMDISKGKWER